MKHVRILLIAIPVLILAVFAGAQRPLMRFELADQAYKEVTRYVRASDDELRKIVMDGARHRHPATRLLHQIMPLREINKDAALLIDRLLYLALEASDAMSLEELLEQIDERGALNPKNNEMKFQAYYYAMRYYVHGNESDAQKSAAILKRFAEVIHKWPLVDGEGRVYAQDDTRYLRQWDANGLWGEWFYQDLWGCQPLLWAWDLIGNSQALQEPGVSEYIERELLRYMVEHQFKYHPPTYGNLEHYILEGLIDFGMLLPEPEYIHRAVRWHNAVIVTQFFADGFWHEGTPAYHKDIWQGVAVLVPRLLKGYSDPPGFRSVETYEWIQARPEVQGAPGITIVDGAARFDDLDLEAIYGVQFRRMEEAVNKLLFPDRTVAGLHDCLLQGYQAWWAQAPTVGEPRLLGSSGHGILGTGTHRDQVYVHLHYGGTHGHEHYDALNIILWAKNLELISEGMYRPLPGDISTREWHTSTAAHNTVVIDERDQGGRFSNRTRRITALDAVSGIPDWRYRSGGHGNSDSDGRLLMFETTFDNVQVIEASGEKSYYTVQPDIYRRTLALVKIDARDCYVVDIFRVKGGGIHDWMLHGPLDVPYEMTLSDPMQPKEGVLHKYLQVQESLRTDQDVCFEITASGGSRLRTFLMGEKETEVILAQAPAMRRMGLAPFVDVRRPGPENVFVAVYEPVGPRETSRIHKVEFMSLGDDMAVGILVELTDGTKDIIVSTMEDGSWTVRQIDEWGVSFAGRFAHARLREDLVEWLSLPRGEFLAAGGARVKGAQPFEGRILSTTRTEARDSADTLTADLALPEGEELKNRALIMDMGGELVQSIIVNRVEPLETGSLIFTDDDPGFSIENGLIRLEHFPNWAIPGTLRFLIDNPQLAILETTIKKPQAGETVRGRLLASFDVVGPEDAGVADVTVWMDEAIIYRGDQVPDDLEIDTRQLTEGQHYLTLRAVSDAGLVGEARSSFRVNNRWELEDPLDPPIQMGWFGPVPQDLTIETSDGWDHDTSDAERYFGDDSRRVRLTDSEEYLVWQTEGALSSFAVVLYTTQPAAHRYVRLEMLADGVWKELEFEARTEVGPSGVMKTALTGTVEEEIRSERFRLRILPGAGEPGEIQIGHVTLKGWLL
ncbi:MAG: hypothetical protein GX162_02910 [Firmicutes bacterium]|nr:hypothetical protein [Bacillota bacterium]